MRKIEREMNRAIATGSNWAGGNTQVITHNNGVSEVFLHGNHIARCYGLEVDVDIATLSNWPTVTTKSRLRALGVNLTQNKGRIFIDGEFVCEA